MTDRNWLAPRQWPNAFKVKIQVGLAESYEFERWTWRETEVLKIEENDFKKLNY